MTYLTPVTSRVVIRSTGGGDYNTVLLTAITPLTVSGKNCGKMGQKRGFDRNNTTLSKK